MSGQADLGAGPPGGMPVTPPPPPPAGEPPGPAAERVLRRSKSDRVVAGVAGGLGRYLGIDPVIVRIAFVLLAIFGGSGVVLYLVGLVVIPEEKPGEPVAHGAHGGFGGQSAGAAIGGALVLIGSLSLAGRIIPAFSDLMGPALLVTVGVLVIVLGGRR